MRKRSSAPLRFRGEDRLKAKDLSELNAQQEERLAEVCWFDPTGGVGSIVHQFWCGFIASLLTLTVTSGKCLF